MKIVDMSHELSQNTPIWDKIPRDIISEGKKIMQYEDYGVEIQKFSFPGQFGTHIDFPAHFIENGKREGDYKIDEFMLPLYIVDISNKVKNNCEYMITIKDVLSFEDKYGKIEENSFVALRSDWYKRWPDKIHNLDKNNNGHSPGWSLEVLEILFDKRKVKAVGHETMDTDSSRTIREQGYICEHYLLERGHYQIELLCNLDKIPPAGATIIATPLSFPNANGIPVRVIGVFS